MEHGIDQRMEQKTGGGCLMLFGLPFFTVGVFILLTALGVTGVEVEDETPAIMLLLFGLVFGGVGAGLMFGRSGVVIDRATMKITKWWGLLVPMKATEYNLLDFDRVTISKENRGSGNSSTIVFPVKLAGRSGVDDFEYKAPTDYQQARQVGEELARFLGRDIEDRSSGVTIHRSLNELDESVRERQRRTRERVRLPAAPWGMKTTIREDIDGTVIEIPSPGLKPAHLAAIIPALVFAGVVGLFFLRPLFGSGTPVETQLFFGGFLGLFFIVIPVVITLATALRKARHRVTITVSPLMLRIEEGAGRRQKVTEILGSDLEEFELVGRKDIFDTAIREAGEEQGESTEQSLKIEKILAPGSMLGKLARMATKSEIVARSDTETIRFGRDLPDDELSYLHAIIMRVLT